MPLGESMQSILKSNKNIMLDKSKHFRKSQSKFTSNKKVEYNLPQSNTKILRDIKSRLKNDQEKADRNQFVMLVFTFIVVAVIMVYLIS